MRSHCIIILQLVFLKLNIIFVRLSHVNSNVFIFTAPEDSTVWNNHSLFIHSAAAGTFWMFPAVHFNLCCNSHDCIYLHAHV